MLNIYKRKTFTINQIQRLLILLMFQYMFMAQFNIFHASFLQKNSKRVEIPVRLQGQPTSAAIEEDKKDVLTYQIKEAEPLYNPIILEAANLHNVDFAMVKAIIMAESGYNKRSVSRQGAGGLMQLMPVTAKS